MKSDTQSKSIKTTWMQKILLLLGSVLFAVMLLELSVRIIYRPKPAAVKRFTTGIHETVSDLELLYKPAPGAKTEVKGQVHEINSSGFRDREFLVKKTPGVRRIVFLGDSTVYGYELGLEDSLPKQLEKALREAGQNVEVLNLGVSGYETSQEVSFFKLVGRQFHPDLVIVGYTLNDVRFASFQLNMFNDQNKWHVPAESLYWYQRLMAFFYRHFRLLQYLDREKGLFDRKEKWRAILRGEKDAWHYLRDHNRINEDKPDSAYRRLRPKIEAEAARLGTPKKNLDEMLNFAGFGDYEMERSHWNITRQAMKELRDLSRQDGFQLKVMIFPFLWGLDRYPMTPLHDFLKSEMNSLGVDVIDSLPAMKTAEREKGGEITLDGVHFSPLGSKLWAEAAAKELELRAKD